MNGGSDVTGASLAWQFTDLGQEDATTRYCCSMLPAVSSPSGTGLSGLSFWSMLNLYSLMPSRMPRKAEASSSSTRCPTVRWRRRTQ